MELERRISFDLGQEVRLITAPEGRTGYVAGVLLIPPYSVLVRWRHSEVTFEAPENLVAILPREFRLVVCDGPPGTTPGGRYGLLSLLGDRLPKGTMILLDDAQRLDEQVVLKRWEKEAGWRYTIKDSGKAAYAIVTV